MVLPSFVNRFNIQSSLSECSSPQQHVPAWSSEYLKTFGRRWERKLTWFSDNNLLHHTMAIKSTHSAFWVFKCISHCGLASQPTRQHTWMPQPRSLELQQNLAIHTEASSLLGSTCLSRATNPKELGWKQMWEWKRICFCFYFLPGPAFWKKKKERKKSIVLQAGALPSFLPSLPCPSTPPSVHTA
jgi:hypothetical protein